MKQFRTVKRKANVGERILITNRDSEDDPYRNGDVLTVKGVGRDGVNYKTAISGFVFHEEYEVIEEVNPKEENEMETKQLTDYSYEELLDAIKAKAQAEVKPNVTKVNVYPKSPAQEVSDALTKAFEGFKLNLPTFKTSQQQRDEIIEQAKRDVADLSVTEIYSTVPTLSGGMMSFYPIGCSKDYEPTDEIQFIVNNEKRTVVALIKWLGTSDVWAKGIAKCAPTDCFNSAIGKVISLRRALGLEVPAEYYNAPQPTELRVGDVVRGNAKREYYSSEKTFTLTEFNGKSYNYAEDTDDWINVTDIGRIIDDSREGE